MKYLLMMNCTKAQGAEYLQWPKEDLIKNMAFMRKFTQELRDEGAFVAAEGLAFPEEAKLVRATSDGTPDTDGVFPESKEYLMGYWIIDVASPEEAYRIAARASLAPAPAYLKGTMPLEVRQIMSGPPVDFET